MLLYGTRTIYLNKKIAAHSRACIKPLNPKFRGGRGGALAGMPTLGGIAPCG